MSYELLTGDCRDVLPTLAADSADAVVCDPPYALTQIGRSLQLSKNGDGTDRTQQRNYVERGFMGKDWDNAGVAFDPATWAAVLRVARPGAYLLAAGSPRTYHRLACAVEDGGWVLTDCLHHIHSQGFPKGQGQLKPAYEPWTLARKPAARVTPLNIEACRVVSSGPHGTHGRSKFDGFERHTDGFLSELGGTKTPENPAGRWPPNLLLTHDERCVPSGVRRVKSAVGGPPSRRPAPISANGGFKEAVNRPFFSYADADGYETVADTSGCVEGCPVRRLDEQAGERPGMPVRLLRRGATTGSGLGYGSGSPGQEVVTGYSDTGGASRFFPTFYCPKAPPSERTLPDGTRCPHPTVKPEKLVSWLCSLVASPGMTILDPFMGSGTTGVCALRMGCRFVGIEQSPEYADYARRRLDAVRPTLDTAQEEIHA